MSHGLAADGGAMGQALSTVPDEFAEQVRDALLKLYDPGGLHRHPLLRLVGEQAGEGTAGGQWLRQALLDAIEALHPAPGVATTSRAWRTYHLLELRYLEGHDVAGVVEQIALSRSQYHREHQRALQAVAAVLWERWGLAARWPGLGAAPSGEDSEEAARREVAQLLPEGSPGPVDAAAVLRGVCDLLGPLCAQRSIVLRLQIPEPPPLIRGERVTLRQALLAVLARALRTRANDTLEVELARQGSEVLVALRGRDGGEPGPASIVEGRPFVEALGGTARYQSGAEGWTVSLAFPASDRPALLVVDNHADFIRLVRRYLASEPWQVIGATDVARAEEQAHAARPRAILLDVVMPGHDGWELLLALKRSASTREIPVIVCSVLDEPEVAISLGAAAYLHKPISQQQLLRALAPWAISPSPLAHRGGVT